MIDAATFASLYHAFWRSITPTCELFIRHINIGEMDRFAPPMQIRHRPAHAALIAEAGFSRFALIYAQPTLKGRPDVLLDMAFEQAERKLKGFRDYTANDGVGLAEDERSDAVVISDRLADFFRPSRAPLLIRPIFSGCGFIDRSEGDVQRGDVLYEIKSVERSFRSVDIYQLLTYYSLSISSSSDDIKGVGLVNPKRGVSFVIGIEELCREVSGLSASELADSVIRTASSGDISR